VTNATEIEKSLKTAVDQHLLRSRKQFARTSNWASDLGTDCETGRYHVLCRLKPELRPLPSVDLLKRFRTGTMAEGPNLRLLDDAGLKIVEQARPYQWPEKQISGRIEGKILVEGLGTIPFEHKACSPNSFRSILKHKEEGIPLTKSKFSWLRKYLGQLQIYNLMDGSEWGCWFYYEKLSGDFFFWLLEIDLEYVERLVRRAEQTNEHVSRNFIPEAKRCQECDSCDFETTACFTGKDYGEGFELAIDKQELNQDLRRWWELKPSKEEFEELNEGIRKMIEGRKVLTEDFKAESILTETTVYDIPKEAKAPFARKSSYYRLKVEKLSKE